MSSSASSFRAYQNMPLMIPQSTVTTFSSDPTARRSRSRASAAPCFLQPVDFALDVGPFAAYSAALERLDAVERRARRRGAAGRFPRPAGPPYYLDAREASAVRPPPAIPAGIAPARGSPRSPARPDPPVRARASAASAGRRVVHQRPNQAPFGGFDLSSPTFGRSSTATAVSRFAAAFRISARTTSSVILALWASRSANWSRAAASGIRAATSASGSGTPAGCSSR